MFLVFLVSLGLAAPAAAPAPSRPPWASIEKASSGRSVRLELGTLGAASQTPYRLAYFVRQTSTVMAGTPELRWADSLSCPALASLIQRLRDAPTPRIDVPGFPVQPGGLDEMLQLDGNRYALTFPGRLSFSAGEAPALGRWVEAALGELEPCWREAPPGDVG